MGAPTSCPQPFFVIATQNPVDLAGTFPLPDSQLDRFLLRIGLGYPDAAAERDMLTQPDRQVMLERLQPVLDADDLGVLRGQVRCDHRQPGAGDLRAGAARATRNDPRIRVGLSPRAGLALLRAARASALLAQRRFVLPEDVQLVFGAVAAHRLVAAPDAGATCEALAAAILSAVAVD